MVGRRFIPTALIVSAILALHGLPVTTWAQSPPPPLPLHITSAATLNQDQTNQVRAYAEYWTAMLKNAVRPEDVEAARSALVRPLSNPGVSPGFRFDYSRLVVPELEKVTGSENLHAACNALIVASQLGSDRAANFLLQHMDALNQPRWQLRLRAASACATLLAGGSLDARRTQQAADRLREAARQEDNPFVLRHHFIAIDHADRTGLDPAERLALRATLLEAIVAVVDRLAANNINEPEPMIASVTSGLLLARQKYITVMDSNEKRAAGQRLGPAIGKMLTLISNQWEIAQADPTLKRSYAAIIQAGEGFLGFIDPLVRGGAAPQTALVNAWNAGNKSRFDEDLAKWQNLLQQPSYAKR